MLVIGDGVIGTGAVDAGSVSDKALNQLAVAELPAAFISNPSRASTTGITVEQAESLNIPKRECGRATQI